MKKIQSLVQNFKAKKETQHKIPNQARRYLFYFVSHRVRIVKMSVKKASFFIYCYDCLQQPTMERREDKIFDQLVVAWNLNNFYILTFPLDGAMPPSVLTIMSSNQVVGQENKNIK